MTTECGVVRTTRATTSTAGTTNEFRRLQTRAKLKTVYFPFIFFQFKSFAYTRKVTRDIPADRCVASPCTDDPIRSEEARIRWSKLPESKKRRVVLVQKSRETGAPFSQKTYTRIRKEQVPKMVSHLCNIGLAVLDQIRIAIPPPPLTEAVADISHTRLGVIKFTLIVRLKGHMRQPGIRLTGHQVHRQAPCFPRYPVPPTLGPERWLYGLF